MDATIPNAAQVRTAVPAELLALGAIWGGSYLFMRVAAPDVPPSVMVEVRLALGALVLSPALWRHRARFPPRAWPRLVLVGMVNSALPFLLYAWAAHAAPAGVGAITSAMTVLFAALVGAMFFGEAIGLRRWLAIVGGMLGVVVLAGGRIDGSPQLGLAVAAGTAASLMYGIGLHLARRLLAGLPAAAVASATLGLAALPVLPFALRDWPVQAVAAGAWAAVAALGVLCTGLAYVLYFRLVARIGAARTSTVTYLVPVFGVAWGCLLLGEALTPAMAVAAVFILGSVAVGQRD